MQGRFALHTHSIQQIARAEELQDSHTYSYNFLVICSLHWRKCLEQGLWMWTPLSYSWMSIPTPPWEDPQEKMSTNPLDLKIRAGFCLLFFLLSDSPAHLPSRYQGVKCGHMHYCMYEQPNSPHRSYQRALTKLLTRKCWLLLRVPTIYTCWCMQTFWKIC